MNIFVIYCCVDVFSDDLVIDVKLCRIFVVNIVVISMEDVREFCRFSFGMWIFIIEYIVNLILYIIVMLKYIGIKYNNFLKKDGIGKEIFCVL